MESVFIIIKLLFLLCSILGFCLYINQKFKIKKEFTLILVISAVSVILTFAGILNILLYAGYLIYIFGLALFVYYIKKCDKKKWLTLNNIVISVFVLYFLIIVMNMHLEHYDNFSHWAVIVKEMLNINMLPTSSSEMIMFQSYPPATACFIYFVCKFVGNSDVVMMIGQTLITVAASITILGFISDRIKNKKIYALLVALVLTTFASVYIGIIPFNELLVDVILTVVGAASTLMLVYYSKDIKKLIIINCITSAFLMLIKNSGVFFVLLNFILTIYFILKQHAMIEKKQIIKYVAILFLIPILTLTLWKQHVKYVFGEEALTTNHAMSVSNYVKNFTDKSSEEILETTKNFLQRIFDYNDINFKIMCLINIIMLIYISINLAQKNRDKAKKNIKFVLLLDAIWLVYVIFLFAMYIFSMPTGGTASLGGYERYLFTVVSYLLIMFVTKVAIDIQKEDNKKILVILSGLIIVFNLLCIMVNENRGFLIGNDNYEISDRKKYDEAIKDKELIKNSKCIIYTTNSEQLSTGYIYFLSKYILNTNVVFCTESCDWNPGWGRYLIVLDETPELIEYMQKFGIEYKGKDVYTLN